jgi:hypothetical protein
MWHGVVNMKFKMMAVVCLAVMVLGPFTHGMAQNPSNGIDPKADTDKDGLTNVQEYQWGTDLNDPDSDGGGAYDGWEVYYETHRATDAKTHVAYISDDYHFDPNSATDEGLVNKQYLLQVMDHDANVLLNDPDGDGWNNFHEFLVGTDPTNPNSDSDQFKDSSDPDPIVSNGDGHFDPNCIQDDHPGGSADDRLGNSDNQHGGNGGGGSGMAQYMA